MSKNLFVQVNMLVVILDSLHIIKNCTGPTALDPKDEKLLVPKGMFGWMDFMEDEKKKKWKIEEKMSGKDVWLRGGGEEKSGGIQLFSL